MEDLSTRRVASAIFVSLFFAFFFVFVFLSGLGFIGDFMDSTTAFRFSQLTVHNSFSDPHRKLLLRKEATIEEPTRIWGEKCTKEDIVINQGPTAPLPNGIPAFTVEVTNACVSGCDISRIHFKCGWFSSAHLINPTIFKRLHYNDCLLNDGKSLVYGETLSFQYANTFPFQLSVSSVVCK